MTGEMDAGQRVRALPARAFLLLLQPDPAAAAASAIDAVAQRAAAGLVAIPLSAEHEHEPVPGTSAAVAVAAAAHLTPLAASAADGWHLAPAAVAAAHVVVAAAETAQLQKDRMRALLPLQHCFHQKPAATLQMHDLPAHCFAFAQRIDSQRWN